MFVKRSLLAFTVPLLVAAGAALLTVTPSCSYSHGDPVPLNLATCDTTARITYNAVIAPIFAQHCLECHATSKASALGGGNIFDNYTAVSRYPNASLLGSIKQAPGYDAMPKGRARISDCEIARIRVWMATGEAEQ
ncbi:MAG: hypothetical protein JWR44_589 [Hymenobacter sp.]|nr:hypothetical protein [Hymenobacter sp.]